MQIKEFFILIFFEKIFIDLCLNFLDITHSNIWLILSINFHCGVKFSDNFLLSKMALNISHVKLDAGGCKLFHRVKRGSKIIQIQLPLVSPCFEILPYELFDWSLKINSCRRIPKKQPAANDTIKLHNNLLIKMGSLKIKSMNKTTPIVANAVSMANFHHLNFIFFDFTS